MSHILMVSDAATKEPETVARQVRSVLEPLGRHTVKIVADTAEAAAQPRQEDFDLLFLQVPSFLQCSKEVRLLLLVVREDTERKSPEVLLFHDTGIDGALAVGYMDTRFLMLRSHSFDAGELSAFVRRLSLLRKTVPAFRGGKADLSS